MPAGGGGTMLPSGCRAPTLDLRGGACGVCAGPALLRLGGRRGRVWTAAARPDRLRPPGAQVDAVGVAVLRLRVADRPVGRIIRGVEAIAAADAVPVGVQDAARCCARARAAPAAVVLQPAADVVRLPHVGADCVELAERHRFMSSHVVALVVADIEAAIVADDKMLAVARIDPDRVVVAVGLPVHLAPTSCRRRRS